MKSFVILALFAMWAVAFAQNSLEVEVEKKEAGNDLNTASSYGYGYNPYALGYGGYGGYGLGGYGGGYGAYGGGGYPYYAYGYGVPQYGYGLYY